MTALLAFFFDTLIGDPRSKLHPVALMGNLISFLEHLLYSTSAGAKMQICRGSVLVAVMLAASYAAGSYWVRFSHWLTAKTELWWLDYIVIAFALSFMISPGGLAKAGKEIYNLLSRDKLPEARRAVGMIVGRDTDKIEEPEIVRATVETIAENTVDGVIAPLCFFAVGGLPMAVMYRAANTMDSMLGYKNERYLCFGRAAARVDDVFNLIPARLTALMFIAAAWLLKFDYRRAAEIMRRDADKHPSPNGGYAEATLAGALHIRLGGENYYFGQKHFRAYMGDAVETLSTRHILECIRMMYTATVLFLLVLYIAF